MSRRTLPLAATVAGALIVSAAAGANASAEPLRPLPLGNFGWSSSTMVVDKAHNHVFVSGETSVYNSKPGGLVVTKPDGTAATRISGVSEPRGMTLSPDGTLLYVAVDGEIDSIDTSTLAVVDHFSTASMDQFGQPSSSRCPYEVAVAGGNLWFSYGCGSGDGGIGVVDLSTRTVTADRYARVNQVSPIRSSSSEPDMLVVGGSVLAVLTVSGDTATVSHELTSVAPVDIALTADGTEVAIAEGQRAAVYATSDLSQLSPDLSSTDSSWVRAVALSDDGAFVAFATDSSSQLIRVYHADTGRLVRQYAYNRPYESQDDPHYPRVLRWNGTHLLTILTDYLNDVPNFVELTGATLTPSAISLSGPASAKRAAALSIQGSISSDGARVAGAPLKVTKTDLHGAHALAGVTSSATGTFTVHDVPAIGGTNTYTVTFAGDSTHDATSKSFRVTVARATPSLSMSTNHALYRYGQRDYVKVHLGSTYSSRTVTVSEREYGTSRWHVVRSARVDSHGNLSTSFVAHRNVTITASFPGDERYAPRSVTLHRHMRAYIATQLGGSYGRSGRYHLFHQSKGGALAVKVGPGKGGENVGFRMQVLRNGTWRTVATDTETLDAQEIAVVGFDGRTYTPLRIRAEFHGDAVNSAASAGWWYVQFR